MTRAAYSCFRPPGFKQFAKLDPGWTRGLTCPAAQTKVQLRKDLAGCQIAIRHSPHQVNATTRRGRFMARQAIGRAFGQTETTLDAARLSMV